jgi:hypothetical protein
MKLTYIVPSESFDFDICNLERSVVQQIESVLGLA